MGFRVWTGGRGDDGRTASARPTPPHAITPSTPRPPHPPHPALVAIGASMGVIAFAVDLGLEGLNSWKFGLLRHAAAAGGGGGRYWATSAAISVTLAVASALLVAFGSPLAAGSGIPEVKAYLNGVHIPGMRQEGRAGGVGGGSARGRGGGVCVGGGGTAQCAHRRRLPPPYGDHPRPPPPRPAVPEDAGVQGGGRGAVDGGRPRGGQGGPVCALGRHRGRWLGGHGVHHPDHRPEGRRLGGAQRRRPPQRWGLLSVRRRPPRLRLHRRRGRRGAWLEGGEGGAWGVGRGPSGAAAGTRGFSWCGFISAAAGGTRGFRAVDGLLHVSFGRRGCLMLSSSVSAPSLSPCPPSPNHLQPPSPGIATAFASPIGGLLLAVEEGASYLSVPTMWRGFLATCTGVTTLQARGWRGRAGWVPNKVPARRPAWTVGRRPPETRPHTLTQIFTPNLWPSCWPRPTRTARARRHPSSASGVTSGCTGMTSPSMAKGRTLRTCGGREAAGGGWGRGVRMKRVRAATVHASIPLPPRSAPWPVSPKFTFF